MNFQYEITSTFQSSLFLGGTLTGTQMIDLINIWERSLRLQGGNELHGGRWKRRDEDGSITQVRRAEGLNLASGQSLK